MDKRSSAAYLHLLSIFLRAHWGQHRLALSCVKQRRI